MAVAEPGRQVTTKRTGQGGKMEVRVGRADHEPERGKASLVRQRQSWARHSKVM